MKPGEVWLVNFEPSVGHEYQKTRPAVIISSKKAIKRWHLITVIPLTGSLGKRRCGDVLIERNSKNNLHSDSLIKVGSIVSFDKKRFIKQIGVIKKEKLAKIKSYLKVHFGLD